MKPPCKRAVAEFLVGGDRLPGPEECFCADEKRAVVILLRGAASLYAYALVCQGKEGRRNGDLFPVPFKLQALLRALPTGYVQPAPFSVMGNRRVQLHIGTCTVTDLRIDAEDRAQRVIPFWQHGADAILLHAVRHHELFYSHALISTSCTADRCTRWDRRWAVPRSAGPGCRAPGRTSSPAPDR